MLRAVDIFLPCLTFAISVHALTVRAQTITQGSAAVELKLVATVGSSASSPNFGAHSGDPRFLYIGQKSGAIRILDFNQSSPLLTSTNFLNVSAALGSSFVTPSSAFDERGLLGGAFHPNFAATDPSTPGYRKFYTYTSETIGSATPNFFHQSETGFTYDHQSVIREWTANPPDAQGVTTINTGAGSRVLMRVAQPQSNHNGGMLAFGADNYLYISFGDGGGSNDNSGGVNSTTDGHTNQNNPDGAGGIGFLGHGNAQDRRNVYGKILRIKPTIEADAVGAPTTTLNGQYRIPDDNPFTAASNPVGSQIPGWQASWVDEIYAFGLRNPFRISFDSANGKLYAGDVGQGTQEEVNLIEKGKNYGWVAREGNVQNPTYPLASNPNYVAATGTSFTGPIAFYPNGTSGTGGQAVIGGYVYRGDTNPALAGKYVFGDLNRQSSGAAAGGRFLYMDTNSPGPNQIFDMTITGSLAKPTARLDGIAEDANGELYYLFENGQVIKLLPKLIPGDINRDGVVSLADYEAWRSAFGTTGAGLAADLNGNGVVDASDYVIWRKYLGTSVLAAGTAAAIPEPQTIVFVVFLALVFTPRLSHGLLRSGGHL